MRITRMFFALLGVLWGLWLLISNMAVANVKLVFYVARIIVESPLIIWRASK